MNNIYNNLDSSFKNLSLINDDKTFIYNENSCINKSTVKDYYNINKLNIFLCNLCLININTISYYCNECNKNIGFNDYLYYNKEYKYKITEIYYHKIKNHDYSIDEKLIDLI